MADQDQNSVPMLDTYEYHAFVTHAEADREIAEYLVSKLEAAGFRVIYASRDFLPGCTIVDEIENAIVRSRRTIMILSENFLKSHWCKYESVLATEKSIRRGRASHIPIIYKMKAEQIPENIKWKIYLDYKDDGNFWRGLFKALSDPDVHMAAALPVPHVAQGLAWSYYYGYLNFVLKDHTGRVKRSQWWHNDVTQRRMSYKFFILIPDSCYCYPTFTQADPMMGSAGYLETFKHTRAGHESRDYTTPVQHVTDTDGQVYYFCGAYATPILSVYEMAGSQLAGMTEEEKSRQVVTFYHTLQNILCHADASHCHGKVYIHTYRDVTGDGSRYPLAAELCKIIQEEIRKEAEIEMLKSA